MASPTSIATWVVLISLIIILLPYASSFFNEFSKANSTIITNVSQSLSQLGNNTNTIYNGKVLEQLVGNPMQNTSSSSGYIYNGLSYTNNPFASNQQLGFSFAFLVPGTWNIILTFLNLPNLIGGFIGSLIGFLPGLTGIGLTGLQALDLGHQIAGILWLAMGCLAISLVSKYPVWSGN
jgi:hypothetical protein